MTDHADDLTDLDVFFDAARRDVPPLSEAALERMTAQALSVQAGLPALAGQAEAEQTARARLRRIARPGFLSQLLTTIGGSPAMAGLATAGVAGLWIGAMPPAALVNLAVSVGAVTETAEYDLYLVDPLPGYALSLDLTEGQ